MDAVNSYPARPSTDLSCNGRAGEAPGSSGGRLAGRQAEVRGGQADGRGAQAGVHGGRVDGRGGQENRRRGRGTRTEGKDGGQGQRTRTDDMD